MGNGKAFPVLLSCLLAVAVAGCGSDEAVEQAAGQTASNLMPASEAGDDIAQAEIVGGAPVSDPVLGASPETETGIEVATKDEPDQASDLSGGVATAPAETVSDGKEYCLLVGSFRNRDNAELRTRQLAADGVRADIVPASVDGVAHHRVRICGLTGVEDARRLGEHLRTDLGIDYLVIQK